MTLQPLFILCSKMLPDYWMYFSLFCECISVYFSYSSVLLYAFTSLCVLCRHISLSVLFQYIYISTCLFLKMISLWKNKNISSLPSVNTYQNAQWIAYCCFKDNILLDSTVSFLALCSLCFLPTFTMWFSRYFWKLGS